MKTQIYRTTHAISVNEEMTSIAQSQRVVRVRLSTEEFGNDQVIFECATHREAHSFLIGLGETIGAIVRLQDLEPEAE